MAMCVGVVVEIRALCVAQGYSSTVNSMCSPHKVTICNGHGELMLTMATILKVGKSFEVSARIFWPPIIQSVFELPL
jgi:hypothetical protein